MVSIWGSHLSPLDNTVWDISPNSNGNVDDNTYPTDFSNYTSFYDYYEGNDTGQGYSMNPVTNQTYEIQNVKRGDYTRVLAEYWADGPDSETPPGHWFVLLNSIKDLNQDIVLIIAGKMWKDDFSYYDKIIKKNKIEDRIIQKRYFISSEERELVFKASDAMILPFEEVYQSASALMGMSYSLPIIASDISGFREFINNGINGFLFNKNDSIDLAKKINILFQDQKL